jgi:hypothetical protein
MAEAVALSPAKKLLLPLTQDNINIIGIAHIPLPLLVDELIETYERYFLDIKE